MYDDKPLARILRDEHVDASGLDVPETAALAAKQMAKRHICLVRGFATEPGRYLEFLNHFGTPLANYSSRSALADHDPHPQINRVKYKRKDESAAQSVHYVAGGLRPHSARSWCAPRPAYFAMLMVDPGWRDAEAGQRGESVVLGWHHLFERLAERDGEVFAEHFARLSRTPVTFEANNVRETLSDSPLLYPLADSAGPFDVGVRLKQDMREKVLGLAESIEDFPAYQEALHYLLDSSDEPAFHAEFPLDAGDVLLLDNNRFAHGRRRIIGERATAAGAEFNPRELWSVTVV